MMKLIGPPLDRVDGRLKVAGRARYSAEFPISGVVHAVMITSTIGRGRVASIDTGDALRQRGVITVLTHHNAPRVKQAPASKGQERYLPVLQDDVVRYDRQPIALAIAETFEAALDAAWRLEIRYAAEPPVTTFADGERYTPEKVNGKPPDALRGDPDAALAAAEVKIDARYSTPVEHHNPMEPHATIATWEGDRLFLYDATQGIFATRKRVAEAFGIPVDSVRVITDYVGGGFGCKGSTWPHVVLAAMAAKATGRPVKLALTRPQMFASVGYRPRTEQRVALAAGRDGKLTGTIHETVSQTSTFDEFTEPSTAITQMLYAVPNLRTTQRLVRLNAATPTFMRAPGESTGSFALESAMDELAYALELDPIELRLRNYAETDPETGHPYSSKSLRECYRLGAERFGWKSRAARPGSMRRGNELVGYGMATATYPTHRSAAAANARLAADGSAQVFSGTQDLGTGSYTIFTQVAADALGLPVERVRFELGDTNYPNAPVSGGSQTAASVGSAVYIACNAVKAKLLDLALNDPQSPLHGRAAREVVAANGRFALAAQPSTGESYVDILRRHDLQHIESYSESKPGEEAERYAMHAFGAQFAEVRVDADFGTIRVERMVGAFASGRILNEKTARSQYLGGMVWGLSMALFEDSRTDLRTGRIMYANLEKYLVPVNADVPSLQAYLVEEVDEHVNPIGVKGIGEIGIVGAAAAIANAVYHATGVRVRDLPIVPEKVLRA
jgi:xanthine dehydrogenase YagR molybdenum-binding subunit